VSEHVNNAAEVPGGHPTPGRNTRKHYDKPSFRFEKVFETMALQCGKMQGTGGACNVVRLAS